MDEFDVFLDPLSRKLALDTMVSYSRLKNIYVYLDARAETD